MLSEDTNPFQKTIFYIKGKKNQTYFPVSKKQFSHFNNKKIVFKNSLILIIIIIIIDMLSKRMMYEMGSQSIPGNHGKGIIFFLFGSLPWRMED